MFLGTSHQCCLVSCPHMSRKSCQSKWTWSCMFGSANNVNAFDISFHRARVYLQQRRTVKAGAPNIDRNAPQKILLVNALHTYKQAIRMWITFLGVQNSCEHRDASSAERSIHEKLSTPIIGIYLRSDTQRLFTV